jgi:hypothetical protein
MKWILQSLMAVFNPSDSVQCRVLRRYEYEGGLPDFTKQWIYSFVCVTTKFCKQKPVT